MENYNSSFTMEYKGHYIHVAHYNGAEHMRAQIDNNLFTCKTMQGAKRKITKEIKRGILC